MSKEYIGFGLYAEYEVEDLITLSNDEKRPDNVIYINKTSFLALLDIAKKHFDICEADLV